MKKIRWYGIVIFLFTVLVGYSQYQGTPRMSGIGVPYFEYGYFRTAMPGTDSVKVTIFMQILNDDLTFISKDSLYEAQLEINVLIMHNERIVQRKILSQTFREEEFTRTNSRNVVQNIETTFLLAPGQYEGNIIFQDIFSNQRIRRQFPLSVEKVTATRVYLSDLLMYTRVRQEGNRLIPVDPPNLLHNFTDNSPSIYVYFELFVQDTTQDIRLLYQLKPDEKNVEKEFVFTIHPEAQHFGQWLKIHKESLERTQYQLRIEAIQGKGRTYREAMISFYWTESPNNIFSLNEAIEQLEYIIPSDTLKRYRNASYEEKKQFFERFWKMLDPDTTTAKNELMDEYYRRVNFANANFGSVGKAGWRTDRGRIYIKFGPPDEIENYPSQMSTIPMQIWRYYSLRKEFVFIDRTGLGDYQLHPDYYNVEYSY